MPSNDGAAAPDRSKFVDLVFEGGGVKGIALVGALSMLEESGFVPQNVAGTSGGAIVAVGHAAGYSAGDLREIILGMDFERLRDRAWEDRLPLIGAPLSVLKDQGVYEGEEFLEWITEHLRAKGRHTFRDLVHPDYADEPRYRYRARVIASDITGRRLLVLPQDADALGATPDDFNIALAVRMSMSIPFFFEPVRHRNAKTGREHLVVDGGLLSNFPVWLFDSDGEPEWPTFGLLLVEDEPRTPVSERMPPPDPPRGGIGATVDYVKGLVYTMLEAHDRLYVQQADFARTIAIPTLGVRTTDFNLSRERSMQLYQSGRDAAERFLETWDFDAYVGEFRRGREHSRRKTIEELMRPGVWNWRLEVGR